MLFYIKIDIISWIIFIGWWFINYFPLENLIIFENITVTALRKKKKKESNLKCTYMLCQFTSLGVIWAKFLIGFELFSLSQDEINIK